MLNKKKLRSRIFANYFMLASFALIATILIAGSNLSAYAWWWEKDDTEKIVKFLNDHADWLKQADILTWVFNSLGWLIIRGLYVLASSLEGLLDEGIGLLSFYSDSGVKTLASDITNTFLFSIMAIALAVIGIKAIIYKNPVSFKNVAMNVIISGILIVGLPSLMTYMKNISISFYEEVQTEGTDGLSWAMIKDNTADLVYVAQNGFDLIKNKSKTSEKRNALSSAALSSGDLTTVLTPDAIKDAGVDNEKFDYLKYFLIYDEKGDHTVMEFSSGGMFSILPEAFDRGYFRYPTKFWTVSFGLSGLIAAYLFTLFIFVVTAIEVGYKRILGLFIFSTDLETGEKTKMVVQDILTGFLMIAFTGLGFRIYEMFIAYMASRSLNPLLYVICIVGATVALIKGSTTVMKYFGIDNGSKDGFFQFLGTMALGNSIRKGVTNTISHKRNNSDNNDSEVDGNSNGEGMSHNSSTKDSARGTRKSVNKKGSSTNKPIDDSFIKQEDKNTGNGSSIKEQGQKNEAHSKDGEKQQSSETKNHGNINNVDKQAKDEKSGNQNKEDISFNLQGQKTINDKESNKYKPEVEELSRNQSSNHGKTINNGYRDSATETKANIPVEKETSNPSVNPNGNKVDSGLKDNKIDISSKYPNEGKSINSQIPGVKQEFANSSLGQDSDESTNKKTNTKKADFAVGAASNSGSVNGSINNNDIKYNNIKDDKVSNLNEVGSLGGIEGIQGKKAAQHEVKVNPSAENGNKKIVTEVQIAGNMGSPAQKVQAEVIDTVKKENFNQKEVVYSGKDIMRQKLGFGGPIDMSPTIKEVD